MDGADSWRVCLTNDFSSRKNENLSVSVTSEGINSCIQLSPQTFMRSDGATDSFAQVKISSNNGLLNKLLKLEVISNAKFIEVYVLRDNLLKYVETLKGKATETYGSVDDFTGFECQKEYDMEFRELQLKFLSLKCSSLADTKSENGTPQLYWQFKNMSIDLRNFSNTKAVNESGGGSKEDVQSTVQSTQLLNMMMLGMLGRGGIGGSLNQYQQNSKVKSQQKSNGNANNISNNTPIITKSLGTSASDNNNDLNTSSKTPSEIAKSDKSSNHSDESTQLQVMSSNTMKEDSDVRDQSKGSTTKRKKKLKRKPSEANTSVDLVQALDHDSSDLQAINIEENSMDSPRLENNKELDDANGLSIQTIAPVESASMTPNEDEHESNSPISTTDRNSTPAPSINHTSKTQNENSNVGVSASQLVPILWTVKKSILEELSTMIDKKLEPIHQKISCLENQLQSLEQHVRNVQPNS